MTYYKSILKEKANILGEKDFLLSKDFRNQVLKDTEAKTKMHNVLKPRPRSIMQCEERKKVLRFNHKLQQHPKCPFRRALHVNKDTEVVVEGAELPPSLFIKKRETDSIPRKRSM